MKNQGIDNSLEAQLNKLARHNRQGSYRTKERYYMAMKRFCHFLADEYRLQKLSNISSKHLIAYMLWIRIDEFSEQKSTQFLINMMKFYEVFKNVIESIEKDLGVPL